MQMHDDLTPMQIHFKNWKLFMFIIYYVDATVLLNLHDIPSIRILKLTNGYIPIKRCKKVQKCLKVNFFL